MPDNDEWLKWSKHVLLTLDEQTADIKALEEAVHDLSTKLEVFKTEMRFKAGMWGAVSGMIPGLGLLVWYLIKTLGT